MAGPAYVSLGTRTQSAGASNRPVALPAGMLSQRGVFIMVVTSKNNETHTCATSGWSKITQVNSGASFTASLWIAAEGVASPTVSWTTAVACSGRMAYYVATDGPTSTTIGANTNSTGSTSTHTTSAITTTSANVLAVYIDVAAANTALGTPAGWTVNGDSGSATDAGRTTFGSKAVVTSGSSSGAISVTGAAAAWVQFQIELYDTIGTGFETSKIDMFAWLEPGSMAAATRRRMPIVN